VRWLRGDVRKLPAERTQVDRVVFSLVLHHLDDALKAVALADARRVLRPGGRVHIADWTTPGDPLMRFAFLGVRLLDGRTGTASLARGELAGMLSSAGFADIVEHDRLRTPFGRLGLLQASVRQRPGRIPRQAARNTVPGVP
jgi:SAM-dependent methyltransferase